MTQRNQLSALQVRVLVALAGMQPAWTLTGGGALAGVHFGHRVTRDLDLFWRGRASLEGVTGSIKARLEQTGMQIDSLQSGPAFQQYRVSADSEVVIVDLVADPVPTIESPMVVELSGVSLQVDTPHEIFVNKLCALLGRSETRDLVDTRMFLVRGFDLVRALSDAPKKDTGFSPLTLAWVLRQFPVEARARASGLESAAVEGLVVFRDELVELLLKHARPSSPSTE